MAGSFPENDVEVLRDYFPPDLQAAATSTATGLLAATIDFGGDVDDSGQGDLALTVVDARIRFRKFLLHESLPGLQQAVGDVAHDFETREFGQARAALPGLPTAPPLLPFLDSTTISNALRATPVRFVEFHFKPGHAGDETGPLIRVPRIVPGYTGFRPSSEQIRQLFDLQDFLRGGSERTFRVGLLSGEIAFGLADFQGAIGAYNSLLAAGAGFAPERVKFVAIRTAQAHVALGERLFRTRDLNPDAIAAILHEYDLAIAVLDTQGVSPDNPFRHEIEATIAAQRAKIEAGFNSLGFKDSYVPLLRPEFLQKKAQDRVALASDAVGRFVDFRERANQLDAQEAELLMQQQVGELSDQIAQERIDIATEHADIAQGRIDAIQDQLDSLLRDSALSALGSALAGTAGVLFATEGGGGIAQGVGGVMSFIVGYFARQNDLSNQLHVAQSEMAIAEREEQIARLEAEIEQVRQQFIHDRLLTLGSQTLSAELFYQLANLFESLAETDMAAAIRWAYLYERAVAFRRLRPDIEVIALDYRAAGGVIPAPQLLATDLAALSDEDVPDTQGQVLRENPISLRTTYPLEFGQFLQTGTMDFVISLYDLDKRRPGTFERRLQQVAVQVVGLIPPTGFSGHITHHGFFLLRDRATTLTATRLVPTDAEFAEAFAGLQTGTTQGDPIGGVIPYLLDVDRKELSAAPQGSEDNPETEALALFEGKGETGRWTLEIANLDLRFISDVLLSFVIAFPEADDELQAKVEDLIVAYEQELSGGDALDRVTAFSLRQQFPDAFADLAGPGGSFTLTEDDSPDITDLRVKTVVAQALDADGKGVEGIGFAISDATGGFTLTRTTAAGGFTEAPDEPIEFVPIDQRVPILGDWGIALTDASQASRLDDVRVFFIHTFTSR